jgi:putative membrane protein
LVALVGFGAYGVASGSPSTFGYLFTVLAIGAAIAWLRRDALPDLLAIGLAIAAIVHLAGGFIKVEHNVLYNGYLGPYNKALGTHLLQYDHFAHAFASFVIVFAAWFLLAAPNRATKRRRDPVILAVGTALGMGGLNEMIEFLATIAHHGAHVGGYSNTGWDLICNFIGAGFAGLILARSQA